MNNFNEVQEMLYNENDQEVKDFIIKLDYAEELYVYAFNYNWDDGFDIPKLILDNSNCDLSTALLLFYNAEGFIFLHEDEEDNFFDEEHCDFVTKLHDDIVNGRYIMGDIQFEIPLNRVEKYKLNKLLDENEKIFLNDIAGKNLDIHL